MKKTCETCKHFDMYKDSEWWGQCYSEGLYKTTSADCPECDHEDVPLKVNRDFGCVFHVYQCPKCGTEAH